MNKSFIIIHKYMFKSNFTDKKSPKLPFRGIGKGSRWGNIAYLNEQICIEYICYF